MVMDDSAIGVARTTRRCWLAERGLEGRRQGIKCGDSTPKLGTVVVVGVLTLLQQGPGA